MMKPFLNLLQYSKYGFNHLNCSFNFVNNRFSLLSLSRRVQTPFHINNRDTSSYRGDKESSDREQNKSDKVDIIGSVSDSGKYKLFKDEDSPLILDVIEERQKLEELEPDHFDEFAGLNLERGVTGVFDIEDLVDVLRRENAQDIFVASLPPHLQYVDYIVVVSGKSLKHMSGMADFIRRLYKKKRNKEDIIPRLEGEKSKDWLAIDLGNIALHVLSTSARPIYDIESLWAVGKDYDEKCHDSDDQLAEILKKHAINLNEFQTDDVLR